MTTDETALRNQVRDAIGALLEQHRPGDAAPLGPSELADAAMRVVAPVLNAQRRELARFQAWSD